MKNCPYGRKINQLPRTRRVGGMRRRNFGKDGMLPPLTSSTFRAPHSEFRTADAPSQLSVTRRYYPLLSVSDTHAWSAGLRPGSATLPFFNRP
jgi:hypothetical protein